MTTAIDVHRPYQGLENGSQIPPQYPGQERTFQDTWHLLMRNRRLIIGCTLLNGPTSKFWLGLLRSIFAKFV